MSLWFGGQRLRRGAWAGGVRMQQGCKFRRIAYTEGEADLALLKPQPVDAGQQAPASGAELLREALLFGGCCLKGLQRSVLR